jgi:parallel beta-helix repeat protein
MEGTMQRTVIFRLFIIISTLLTAVLLLKSFASVQYSSDIVVNTTSDVEDFGGSQQIADLPGPDGVISLREAITAANNTPGPQVITFNIPKTDPQFDGKVFTIRPLSRFQNLWDGGTTVDGNSQTVIEDTNPLGPEIVIDGSQSRDPADGFEINSASNIIKGLVVNGFGGAGISLKHPGADNNLIAGCYIGLNAAGDQAVPNLSPGIAIESGAENNIIGGTDPKMRNVISGNRMEGIYFFSFMDVETDSNVIIGNYIGLNGQGTSTVPNNGGGIAIYANLNSNHLGNLGNNIIGGSEAGAGNYICGNKGDAVNIDAGSDGNLVIGNFISENGRGVVLGGQQNTVSRNSIFSNGGESQIPGEGLGIDLNGDGVTLNDIGDVDSGPNGYMNFPSLLSACLNKSKLIVQGTIDTQNPESVIIEFFANPVPDPGIDPSGYGEGAIFLGAKRPNSIGKFTAVLPAVEPGTLISATATDGFGNTSEFALNIVVVHSGK